MTLSFVLIVLLLACGLWMLCGALFFHDASFEGSAELRRYGKWSKEKKDFWSSSILQGLTRFACRFVFLDDSAEEQLSRQLTRAGLSLTPKEFTARRYVILFFGAVGAGVCGLMKFWLGIILCVLLAGFGLMKQRDALQAKLKEKDEAISLELPRFVRTICRNLRGNRDLYAALLSYRKVSGPVLGAELDWRKPNAHGVSRTNGVLYIFRLQQDNSRIASPYIGCNYLCNLSMYCIPPPGSNMGIRLLG